MKNSRYLFRLILSSFWWMAISSLIAQNTTTITLDSCYQWAQHNYPLAGQYDLLEYSNDLNLENLSTKKLPQLIVSGQATYQSDVTEIPIMVPGIDIPAVSRDQYKLYGEITQSLTQFKSVRQEIELTKTNHLIKKKELTISLRQLKSRVNTLFFGILLMEAQMEQSYITKSDINTGLQRLKTAVENGTALPSDVNQLKAELLHLDQKIYTLQSKRNHLIRELSLLTGQNMNEQSTFDRPLLPPQPAELQRPELELYTLQQSMIDQQKNLFHQQIRPRVNLFLQGGYGKPALNFLDEDFTSYFIGGLRFQWNISSSYTRQRKDEIWDVQKRSIGLKSETFKFNTTFQMDQYSEEIKRYQNLIKSDQKIITLRISIKNSAEIQLSHGTITPMDYLSFVHQEEQARQAKVIHEIHLLQASYNWLYENGN